MKKVISIASAIFVYVIFAFEIICFCGHPAECSFSENINSFNASVYPPAQCNYIYQIEDSSIIEDDIFKLVNISGWIIKEDSDIYTASSADIILHSENIDYKVRSYREKRTDIYYLNQIQKGNEELYAGFLARFPAESLEGMPDEYQIGFLVKENGSQVILWTDTRISI